MDYKVLITEDAEADLDAFIGYISFRTGILCYIA